MNFTRRKNLTVVAALGAMIAVMVGLVAVSPALYRLFCAVTGFGGTTQRAEGTTGPVSDRTITVSFSTDVAPDLPWRFEPEQRQVQVKLGRGQVGVFSA